MKTHWKSYKEWVDSWIPYITRPRNCHNSVNVISYYYIVDLCNPLLSRREEVGIGGTSQTEMLNSNFVSFFKTCSYNSLAFSRSIALEYFPCSNMNSLQLAHCPKYRHLNIWVKIRSLNSKETFSFRKVSVQILA